ncbi:hypothetical protein B0A55_05925 [Friedmanniomyces simplex]|uniref:Uncharacterized protein n=1 Tax=Friedmanniomyces simplex TaxID=329884 RepID=A0A4U0XK19_9PEZI|nr:hypothetical protein B0A55_05925 [Friedmanniomyces simplex]
MPPSFSDQVSVFHFTNRISSAKIRKYKIATERGMGPGGESQRASSSGPLPTPAPQVLPAGTVHAGTPAPTESVPPGSASPSPATGGSPSMEPPAKKPKLKLTVKPQEPSRASAAQSIEPAAVTRPKREIRYRMRYDENMVLDDESLRIHSPTSSELSSIESTPPPKRQRQKQKQANPINRDYGEMANYYIAADDDDPKETPANPPPKATAKPRKRAPAQPRHPPQMPPQSQMPPTAHGQYPPQDPRYMPMQQQHRPAQPPANYPPPPSIPPPKVELTGFEYVGQIRPLKRALTVQEMVDRLSGLSAALTNFGGVPATPSSPLGSKNRAESKKRKIDPAVDNTAVDSLLGAIGGDEDDSGGDKSGRKKNHGNAAPAKDEPPSLDYFLQNPGAPDGPLSYGIQFIQNALKSWAYQRLQQQHTAHWQQYVQMQGQQYPPQPPKKGPGRPRKFTDGKEESSQKTPPPPKPQIVRIKAENTPEGVAVHAFQQVLESGCLRVNAALPQELKRTLRILYMQIDHLINQGSKNEPHWHCMSYGAQIAANKSRVERWREAQAKAQMEMERQQQLSQQQLMQQMSMPNHPTQHLPPSQAQHAHLLELETRRNAQHAAQQPYNSQQHLNPLQLGSQSAGTPMGYAPSPSPANYAVNPGPALNGTPARRSSTPRSALNSAAATPSGTLANGSSEQQHHQQHLERMTVYTPGAIPRPGMKFSFAPTDPQALRVWGAGAFPAGGPNGSNIPNRGPMMSHSPTEARAQGRALPVKAAGEAVVPSIESGMKDANGSAKEQVPVKKEFVSTPMPVQTNGFNAIDVGGAVMPPASPAVVALTSSEEMAAQLNKSADGVAVVEKLKNGHGGASGEDMGVKRMDQ